MADIDDRITIGVYRMNANDRDVETALPNHELRKTFLKEMIDPCETSDIDWGGALDDQPHEYVHLIVDFVQSPAFPVHLAEAIVTEALASTIIEAASHSFKRAWALLRKGKEEQKIESYTLADKSGLRINENGMITTMTLTRTLTIEQHLADQE